ncbi:BppU family phage baseplate upper protein [Enterococcus avium]|uniref:BppU family phage baseplate upper protein n=1 Tax=Enterococcus avium TaxID=33945 RepID=UPI0034A25059
MFKTNEEIIIIQAKATTPIPTGVVFWSHDKGTAKMLFQLQKDYVNQTLSEGTIVPICLDFVGGRHIYHAIIEDAINGIVSIVLEDNILGYQGRVDGSIYIELPDSRSLDTAGRFTFDIKRSPIDLNTPELEDYYWQGFNEIIDEYHQTINTIKSEAKALIDSLTADVTTAQSKITQLEQSITTANTNLNARIDEINKKIDDNDVFTKAESSANVIDQIVSGNKEKIVFSTNFSGKVSGSLVENANSAYTSYSTELNAPTAGTWYEFSDERYSKISDLDDIRDVGSHKANGQMVLIRIEYDVVDILTRVYSNNFWLSQGIFTLDEKVTYIKNNVSEITPHVFGFGSGPSGNRLQLVTWRPDTKVWNDNGVTAINSTIQVKDIYAKHSPVVVDQYGKINILLYSYVSDGTIPSGTSIDYSELEIALNISANEHIESMIAANHRENLATQEEAEAGTDTTKTMTPATTAQSIDNRAVTLASNQTIGGIKNFKDGLMINDVSLSTITRKVIYEADGVGGYFNAADKFTLGASGKIDKIVLLWSRVDDTAGTLLNYSWSQTVLSPDDLVVGNSYRIQMTTDNYKFVTFANESGNVTISGANENSVAPNRIYRIKRIIAYLKN